MAKDFADISRLETAEEMNATNKRESVSKLMKAWESKNAKRAAQGAGLTTMAVTLAACGGEDTTPFAQADIDAAVAPIQTQLTAATAAKTAAEASLATATAAKTAAEAAQAAAEGALATLRTDLGVASDATTTEMMNAITALETAASSATAANAAAQTALADLRTDLGVASDATTTEMMSAITALEASATTAAAARDAAEANLAALRTDLGLASDATVADMISAITALETAAATAADNAVAALGIAGITTLAQLNAAYDALANPTVTVFNLTTGIDTLTGSAGNDTFIADNTGTDVTSTADTVNGGDGADTFNLYSDGAAGALPSMISIETLNVFDQDANFTLSAVDQASVTTLNFIRGDGLVTYTIGANVTTVGLENIVLAGSGDGSADTTIAAAATATSLTLNLDRISTAAGAGDEDIDVTGAALTTVTINTSGTAVAVDNMDVAGAATINVNAGVAYTTGSLTTSSTTATLTISGAGAVSIGQLDNGIDTVVATSNTGGVTMTAPADNAAASITLSAGNDVFTTDDDGFATTDTFAVNAGAGTADVLVIAAAVDTDTAAEGARYTNFEILRTGASQDMDFLSGITAVQVEANTSASISDMTATQAANVTMRADNTTSTVFALKDATGSADSITINLVNSASATTGVDVTGLSVDNIETVNIVTSTGTNDTDINTVAFLANSADEVSAINVTGDKDLQLTVIANTLDVVAVNIDASGMSGTADFVLVQTADLVTGSTVTGTSQGDTMALGTTRGSTYNGGDGNDRFDTVIATLVSTGTNDTVLNGGGGTDTLHIDDDGSTMTDNHFTFVSNMEALTYDDGGSVSLTTGSAFTSAFASGVTITAAGMDDAATFTYAGGLYDLATTIAVTSAAVGNGAAEDMTITTGDAADSVTLTAASFVGSSNADGGSIAINTAGGNDTISLTVGDLADQTTSQAITITGGAGQDTITVVKTANDTNLGNAVFIFANGDSTTSAYDTITGFDVSDGTETSDVLNFAGTAAIGTLGTTVDFGTILSHSVNAGVATFDDAANYSTALVINESNLADVLGYLAANTATNDVIAFTYDSDASGTADATMVYHNYTVDTLVLLAGVTGVDALITTNTPGANDLMIA